MNFFKGLKNQVKSKFTQVSPYPRDFAADIKSQPIELFLLAKPRPLAIIVHEQGLQVYDVQKGVLQISVKVEKKIVMATFNERHKYGAIIAVFYSDSYVDFYEPTMLIKLQSMIVDPQSPVTCIDLSHGRGLLTGHVSGTTSLYELEDGSEQVKYHPTLSKELTSGVSQIACTGEILYVAHSQFIQGEVIMQMLPKTAIRSYDLEKGTLLTEIMVPDLCV